MVRRETGVAHTEEIHVDAELMTTNRITLLLDSPGREFREEMERCYEVEEKARPSRDN